MGWLAGLAARLPLPWRAVQGQTHAPLSLQAAMAAAVSEESALLAAIAVASCCC